MFLPFPSLLYYDFFASLLLRIALAIFFITASAFHQKKVKAPALSTIEALLGVCFILGFGTQIASFVGMLYTAVFFFLRKTPRVASLAGYGRLVYLLVGSIALSLLLLGPGPFAIDLPL